MYYYDEKGNKIQGSTKHGFNKPVSTKQTNDVENEGEGGSKHPMWFLIMLSLISISIIVYLIWYFFLKK